MQPLNILYTEAATSYGGQERYLHRLMLAMRDKGHQVEALCQPTAELRTQLEHDGFVVHQAVMHKGSDFWRNLLPLRKLIKAGQYDVVNTTSRRDTVHAGIAARLAGVPLVVRSRHLAKPIGSLFTYKWIPHRIITVSQFVKNQLTERGINEDHVAIAPPAVALPDPLPTQRLRAELGLDEQALIVGSIAVLRKEKGTLELIQAMAPLLREHSHLHVVIIGGGGQLAALQQFAEQLDVLSQIHFLGVRYDVPELIGDFDIFALATYLEASGTAFLEAGAARVAVVGTRVGGVPEMIDEGHSGMLVPLHDVVALRNALQRLIQDADLRQQMGQAGYNYVVNSGRFSVDALQQTTERSYYRWLEQLTHV